MDPIHPEPLARGKMLAKVGAWMQMAPLIGVAATIIGTLRAFKGLRSAGINDPRALAGQIGEVLIYTWIGLCIGQVGLLLIGIALLTTGYRARWIFWLLMIYAALLLWSFPIGSAVSIALLYYGFTHRSEFFKSESSAAPVDQG